MSELSDLLVAIGTLVSTVGGTVVLVWTSVVQPRRQRDTAQKAARTATTALLDALADGEITPAELSEIRKLSEEEKREGT